MKKIISLLFVVILVCGVLVGCGGSKNEADNAASSISSVESKVVSAVPSENQSQIEESEAPQSNADTVKKTFQEISFLVPETWEVVTNSPDEQNSSIAFFAKKDSNVLVQFMFSENAFLRDDKQGFLAGHLGNDNTGNLKYSDEKIFSQDALRISYGFEMNDRSQTPTQFEADFVILDLMDGAVQISIVVPEYEANKETYKSEFETMLQSIDYDLETLQNKLPQEREISSKAVLDMMGEASILPQDIAVKEAVSDDGTVSLNVSWDILAESSSDSAAFDTYFNQVYLFISNYASGNEHIYNSIVFTNTINGKDEDLIFFVLGESDDMGQFTCFAPSIRGNTYKEVAEKSYEESLTYSSYDLTYLAKQLAGTE